ncbi:hypothetical protein CHS0354_000488 [Potamilus streckersoni]|uniref:Inorganic pyrophosphatase n=1 Tax=Potamilus streckersoni TaxID=2493646 RepID=A0AAE0T708_9BIVA|nr:hypothetical protein CHS0354_000488 [Potamilus streckersoni]
MVEDNLNDTLQLALQYGLSKSEFSKIVSILGRTPNQVELGVFSVMWSEHCSYKNSILEIKKFPKGGPKVLAKAGEENAGLIDIGDGLVVAFKMESHNHPSAIEPYQGAATGVGGIHRDIFTMGARPIATLNSLRFGYPIDKKIKKIVKDVVRGISDYGNAFGVPTVGGETYFEKCYVGNPLVNVMSVGILNIENIARAIAYGEGNIVMIVGSRTGRDGVHGATFASEEISESSRDKRPSVQVGDPFMEKLLLEGTLQVIEKKLIVGVQDMGAAGITCSTAEMTAKGIKTYGAGGMDLNLDFVPTREDNMTAHDIMLSESQERMLLVVKPENVKEVKTTYEKWGVIATEIGFVTNTKKLIVRHKGEIVVDIPPTELVLGGGAPVYERDFICEYPGEIELKLELDVKIDLNKAFMMLLASPNICSKEWIFEQFDSMILANSVSLIGSTDAAIVRLPNSNKGLAMKVDCNSRYVEINPKKGAIIAVFECARNIACVGGSPLGLTNCLNFGNPYNPHIFYQFKESIRGISEACTLLNIPVTGGNVSFYNETKYEEKIEAVYPTPAIGIVGLIDNLDCVRTPEFKRVGDRIYVVGEEFLTLNGSEYVKRFHGVCGNDAPFIDAENEIKLQNFLKVTAKKKLLQSAHDISDGGLAVALTECVVLNKKNTVGATIKIYQQTDDGYFYQKVLFSESQGRVLISVSPSKSNDVEKLASTLQLKIRHIGEVKNREVSIFINDVQVIHLTREKLADIYVHSLSEIMDSFLNAIIEISKGSKLKYEIDKETGLLCVDRVLHSPMMYPANYGFIPQTHCDDGDPLDVLVLCQENIQPTTLVKVRLIGVMKLLDGGELDDKLIAVTLGDPSFVTCESIDDLYPNFLDELKHFFTEYKRLEKKKIVEVLSFGGIEEAEKTVAQAISDYKKLMKDGK